MEKMSKLDDDDGGRGEGIAEGEKVYNMERMKARGGGKIAIWRR